jgi:hypothetical protein
MTVDDPGEDVGQISERIDVVQLAGLDQRGDGGPVLGATVRTCEQSIFPIERDGTDRALIPALSDFRERDLWNRLKISQSHHVLVDFPEMATDKD